MLFIKMEILITNAIMGIGNIKARQLLLVSLVVITLDIDSLIVVQLKHPYLRVSSLVTKG
jgi:hypothetical protein